MNTSITLIVGIGFPLLGIVLAIIFVASHKRIAKAQEDMANAHSEIAKQLANIAIELRHREK
jgi:hypothetical protein